MFVWRLGVMCDVFHWLLVIIEVSTEVSCGHGQSRIAVGFQIRRFEFSHRVMVWRLFWVFLTVVGLCCVLGCIFFIFCMRIVVLFCSFFCCSMTVVCGLFLVYWDRADWVAAFF